MSLTIKPRRGPQSNLPILAPGEMAITSDTYRLYVGTANGNAVVGGSASGVAAMFGGVQATPPANGAGGAMPANADGWTQATLPDGTAILVPYWLQPVPQGGTLGNSAGGTPMTLAAWPQTTTAIGGGPTPTLSSSGIYMGMWGRFWKDSWFNNTTGAGSNGTTPRDPMGVGTSYTGDSNLTAIKEYEADAGHHVAICAFWRNFGTGSGDLGTWGTATGNQAFAVFNAVKAHGSVPFVTWSPTGSSVANPAIGSILNGSQNAYLDGVGAQLAAYGGPLMIRMMHEMNGSWYPHWSPGQTDNGLYITTALYQQAWRYIVDRIRAAGATNVQWVYCPNTWTSGGLPNGMAQYPGNSYVDWIGLDGYNAVAGTSGWQLFNALFGYAYNAITSDSTYNGIPLVICESGCSPADDGIHTKASWYADTFNPSSSTGIFNYPRIRAFIQFNEDKRYAEQAAGTVNPLKQAWPIEMDEAGTNTATGPGNAIASAVAAHQSLFLQHYP
jgi:hypothetical protein